MSCLKELGKPQVCTLLALLVAATASAADPPFLVSPAASPSELAPSLAGEPGAAIDVDWSALALDRSRVSVGAGVTYELVVEAREQRARADLTLVGRLVLDGHDRGQVIVTRRGHTLAATLLTASGTFRVVPVAAGRHVLIAAGEDTERRADECPGTVAGLLVPPAAALHLPTFLAPPATEGNQVTPVVDVLVLYTFEARAAAGGIAAIETRIQHAVDFTNTAFSNSEVTARIRLADAAAIDYSPSTVDPFEDLFFLGTSRQVAELREKAGADQVGLVKARCQPTGCGRAFGMERSFFGTAAAPAAFFVTSLEALPENFSHELGHNFGCQHEPGPFALSSDRTPFPFAFAHFETGLFRTLMDASNGSCDACPKIPHFSSPDVLFESRPTGIEGERDNARAIDETAPTIERFGHLRGRLGFDVRVRRVEEGTRELVIDVFRTNGSIGDVSVHYRTEDRSARAGEDYQAVSGTLTWATGEADILSFRDIDIFRKRIPLRILDDSVAEGEESFVLVLNDPTGGAALGNAVQRVTIHDEGDGDDPEASILAFATGVVNTTESATELALSVVRLGGASGTVTVDYATADGSAKATGDYTAVDGTLIWEHGDASAKEIKITIHADTEHEVLEDFTVSLSNPTGGASLGSPGTIEVRIVDAGPGGCDPDEALCLRDDGRFEVRAALVTEDGPRVAKPVRITADTGYFWVFSPNNVELVVKVLFGCKITRHYWVFAAGLTNQGTVLTVRDTATDGLKVYTSPLTSPGSPFPPITDTQALDTCP